ncbi:substrate-binding periplasmic protein [Marinobacter sediminum]|uniref:substrate-binding periplasmic protein n=1 Tax=Marinobacter sediminum TaxID=256323 RepID=UPI0019399D32|nr:transporter substrate-binding domain-containing protein [Marinobacter sediminum]
MNRILAFFVILFFSSLGHVNGSGEFPKLDIYMEEWDPFQFEDESGEVKGFAVDLLDMMLKDVNSMQSKSDFKFIPWARLVANLKRKDTLGFSMLKTPEREGMYQWIGPFHTINNYVIVKKYSALTKESFNSGNNVTAATVIGDASVNNIRSLGVNEKNIYKVSNIESTIRMLDRGRVDIIVDNWENFRALAIKLGIDFSKYKRLINFGGNDIYFVLSRNTDPEIVGKLQLSFEKIKVSSQFKDLLKKYKLGLQRSSK